MTLENLNILLTIIGAIAFVVSMLPGYRPTDILKQEKLKIKKLSATIVWALCVIGLISTTLFWNNISAQGAYTKKVALSQLIKDSKIYPVESILPNDLDNTIIIFYKYGCKDCTAVLPMIRKETADFGIKNIYYISSKSETGKKLVEKYGVQSVPTGVLIQKNTNGDSFVMKKLDTNDGNNGVTLHRDNLIRLFELQNKDKLLEKQYSDTYGETLQNKTVPGTSNTSDTSSNSSNTSNTSVPN